MKPSLLAQPQTLRIDWQDYETIAARLSRETLEKFQALIYLAAIGCGMGVGAMWPEQASALEGLLWPVLALLLYSTFTQVPLAHLRQAVSDLRFIQAAIFGNFVLIPAILWASMGLLPENPAMRLGIVMVLVAPCFGIQSEHAQLVCCVAACAGLAGHIRAGCRCDRLSIAG